MHCDEERSSTQTHNVPHSGEQWTGPTVLCHTIFFQISTKIYVDWSPFFLKFVITCLKSCRKKNLATSPNFQEILKLSNDTKLLLHAQSTSSIGARHYTYIHTYMYVLKKKNSKIAFELMLLILKYVWTINKPT